MAKVGKRFAADLKKADPEATFSLVDAVAKIKSFSATKFDQTIDICIHLGIDPKQSDQQVRASVSLPHGTGKKKRVIAFCQGPNIEAAIGAGAVEAGGEDLVKKITAGWMDFDVAVASPDMMRFVGKLGKQLGPRGLMPSPKAGTVTPKVESAVAEYVAGKVNFKNDTGGNIHAPVGKMSFSAEQLEENAAAFIALVDKLKPSGTKGQYFKKITLAGTMTPGAHVAL